MKKLGLKIIIVATIVIAIVISFYFYFQYRKTQKLLQNPTLIAAQEAKSLVARVVVLIELPSNEDPTIATVSDKNKLANQPFFANSQNGDKVLIYSRAKKAILYRPSINKIIEVAPISSEIQPSGSNPAPTTAIPTTISTSPTTTPTTAPAQKIVKVAVYNGTKTAGLAASYATQLTDKISNIEIVAKGNANGDYASMLVVDLTGGNSVVAKQIASELKGTIGTLPKGEDKPAADLLVIVGK
jgi:hypothetical protein